MKVEHLSLIWTSMSGEGFQLELYERGSSDDPQENGRYLGRIVADEDERQWLEIEHPEGPVRISVPEIERAIENGKKDIHGERYYDDK